MQFDQVKGYANGIANAKLIVEGCVFPNSKDSGQGVDWSEIPMDTPVLVRDDWSQSWRKRHFAAYKNGYVYAWPNGKTSWICDNDEKVITSWNYAKLPEEAQE